MEYNTELHITFYKLNVVCSKQFYVYTWKEIMCLF